MNRARPQHRSRGFVGIFGTPLVLAVLSATGLLAALVGDDGWHVVSWLGLATPLAIIAWHVRPR